MLERPVTLPDRNPEIYFTNRLELIVKRDEGFAYLKQMTDESGNTLGLVPRKPLGFECSVLAIILREVLEEFDSNLDELYTTACYITGKELKERIELFLPERFNRVKLLNELDSYIARMVQLGFLIRKRARRAYLLSNPPHYQRKGHTRPIGRI